MPLDVHLASVPKHKGLAVDGAPLLRIEWQPHAALLRAPGAAPLTRRMHDYYANARYDAHEMSAWIVELDSIARSTPDQDAAALARALLGAAREAQNRGRGVVLIAD